MTAAPNAVLWPSRVPAVHHIIQRWRESVFFTHAALQETWDHNISREAKWVRTNAEAVGKGLYLQVFAASSYSYLLLSYMQLL